MMNQIDIGQWSKQCLVSASLLLLTAGCTVIFPAAEAQRPGAESDTGPISVDVEQATPLANAAVEYTGSTQPVREVALRSQVQGQLMTLAVEVGDRVRQGQVLGNVDDEVLLGAVNQATAEGAAQAAEAASARSQVGEVKTQVEQARLALVQAQGDVLKLKTALQAQVEEARLNRQQTQADAQRLTQLAKVGGIPEQQAEQARTLAQQAQQTFINVQANATQQIAQAETAVRTARQVLASTQAQVAIEQDNLAAAQLRVAAQQAAVNQAQKQRSYATVIAPIGGLVLSRQTEAGNLLQPGNEILRLGDFSQVKVVVQVSERLLAQLRVGQQAQVWLDAFPGQRLRGTIARISPLANATSRLLPVEVVIPNPNGKLGSGLLARVSFESRADRRISVPETAFGSQAQGQGGPPSSQAAARSGSTPPGATANAQPQSRRANVPRPSNPQAESADQQTDTVFVLQADGTTVQARTVTLGDRQNGRVDILSGLALGERYIVRSSRPLEDGATVRLSAISTPAAEDSRS